MAIQWLRKLASAVIMREIPLPSSAKGSAELSLPGRASALHGQADLAAAAVQRAEGPAGGSPARRGGQQHRLDLRLVQAVRSQLWTSNSPVMRVIQLL